MTPIPIKERETDEYALAQPSMLSVNISSGEITIDRRDLFLGIAAINRQEEIKRGKR